MSSQNSEKCSIGVFMIYFNTTFHMPNFNGPLVAVMKRKTWCKTDFMGTPYFLLN